MKLISTLTASIILLCTFAAHSQTYTLSRALGHTDPLVINDGGIMTGFDVPGLTFNETVTIDVATQTIEQSGSFTLPGLSQTLTAGQSQTLPPVFPNPPQTVTGDFTIGMQFNTTLVSFDTGPQPLTYNGQTYQVKASAFLAVPITYSYSLVTSGQTYSASSVMDTGFTIDLGSEVDTTDYPSSIALVNGAAFGPLNTELADFTAPDGFQVNLVVTPEPSTWMLASLGGLMLVVYRRRK